MSTETPRQLGWKIAIGVIAFVVFSWLFANWSDFKTGFEGGYSAQAGKKP